MDRMEDRTFKAYFWSFLTVLTENIHDATYRKRSRTRPPSAKSTLPCAQKEWSKNIRFSLEIDGMQTAEVRISTPAPSGNESRL
jgi:hypothetical protein